MRQGAISISISISTYFFLLFFSFLSSCLACFLHNQCGQWPGSQGTTMPPPMPTSGGNISVMPRGVPLVCALVLLVLFFSFLFYSCLVDFLHNQCGQWPGSQGTTMPTPMPTSGGNISVMPRGVPLVCALVLLVLVLVLIFSRRLVDFLHNQCGHLAGSRGPTMPALMPTSGGNMSLMPRGVPLVRASSISTYIVIYFIFFSLSIFSINWARSRGGGGGDRVARTDAHLWGEYEPRAPGGPFGMRLVLIFIFYFYFLLLLLLLLFLLLLLLLSPLICSPALTSQERKKGPPVGGVGGECCVAFKKDRKEEKVWVEG